LIFDEKCANFALRFFLTMRDCNVHAVFNSSSEFPSKAQFPVAITSASGEPCKSYRAILDSLLPIFAQPEADRTMFPGGLAELPELPPHLTWRCDSQASARIDYGKFKQFFVGEATGAGKESIVLWMKPVDRINVLACVVGDSAGILTTFNGIPLLATEMILAATDCITTPRPPRFADRRAAHGGILVGLHERAQVRPQSFLNATGTVAALYALVCNVLRTNNVPPSLWDGLLVASFEFFWSLSEAQTAALRAQEVRIKRDRILLPPAGAHLADEFIGMSSLLAIAVDSLGDHLGQFLDALGGRKIELTTIVEDSIGRGLAHQSYNPADTGVRRWRKVGAHQLRDVDAERLLVHHGHLDMVANIRSKRDRMKAVQLANAQVDEGLEFLGKYGFGDEQSKQPPLVYVLLSGIHAVYCIRSLGDVVPDGDLLVATFLDDNAGYCTLLCISQDFWNAYQCYASIQAYSVDRDTLESEGRDVVKMPWAPLAFQLLTSWNDIEMAVGVWLLGKWIGVDVAETSPRFLYTRVRSKLPVIRNHFQSLFGGLHKNDLGRFNLAKWDTCCSLADAMIMSTLEILPYAGQELSITPADTADERQKIADHRTLLTAISSASFDDANVRVVVALMHSFIFHFRPTRLANALRPLSRPWSVLLTLMSIANATCSRSAPNRVLATSSVVPHPRAMSNPASACSCLVIWSRRKCRAWATRQSKSTKSSNDWPSWTSTNSQRRKIYLARKQRPAFCRPTRSPENRKSTWSAHTPCTTRSYPRPSARNRLW
jgi:hypothetical protein